MRGSRGEGAQTQLENRKWLQFPGTGPIGHLKNNLYTSFLFGSVTLILNPVFPKD